MMRMRTPRPCQRILLPMLLCCALLSMLGMVAGCSKPGSAGNNLTNCIITLTSINEGKPLQSDVLTKGYAADDVINVKFKSEFRTPADDPTAPTGPSRFDTITFHTYYVTHMRSDGGANPSAFTGGMNVIIAADSTAEANVVVVRAFDKNRYPLQELRNDGEIFTTSTITLYGTDGNGNDLAVSGALSISYANFPDQ